MAKHNSSRATIRIGPIAALSAIAFAIATVAQLTIAHAQLATSPWPMFHHDLAHTGLSPYNTSANPGTQRWAFATGGFVDSSPTIGVDGTIYVGSYDGNLYAVEPGGTQKWKFATGGMINFSSPAIGANGTIYVGSSDHNLYAVNLDGTQKWAFATGGAVV